MTYLVYDYAFDTFQSTITRSHIFDLRLCISIYCHTFTLFILIHDAFELFSIHFNPLSHIYTNNIFGLRLCIQAIFNAFQSIVTCLHCLSSKITYLVYDYAFELFFIHFNQLSHVHTVYYYERHIRSTIMYFSYFRCVSIYCHSFTLFILIHDIFDLELCIRAIFDAFQSTVTHLHCLSSQITYLIYDYAFELFSMHFNLLSYAYTIYHHK
jgi:hypothetical protein